MPRVINTDKAECYSAAIRELKEENTLSEETQHRQVKYLNNIVESNHANSKDL